MLYSDIFLTFAASNIINNNRLTMNKRIFTIICLLITVITLHAQEFETATEAVKNMKVGWNLGNTFDSHKIGVTGVTETETQNGQAVTTPELMEMMKMAGFNAIRVPVTWYPHLDASGNIDPAWMNRIQEVVDYVINQGMYCIINVHHDTGKTGKSDENKGWLRATRYNYTQNKDLFESIWQQVATEFRDYNHLLLFEGYNEMLDTLDSFNYASYKTDKRIDITNEEGEVVAQIPYDADVAQSAYDAVNAYAKSFVETVRATGGNNAHRNLIVSTYAAADARSQGTYNKEPFVKMQKPEDSNHIAFEIHTYPPIVDDTLRSMEYIARQIDYMVSNIDTFFVQRYNAPIIIGEWGTSNVDAGSGKTDYDLHREHMFNFVDYFVQKMKENDIATFYWMGLSDKTNRSLPVFNQADLAEKILKAYYGEDYEPNLISQNDYHKEYQVNFAKQYAEINLAEDANGLETNYKAIRLVLAEAPASNKELRIRAIKPDNTHGDYNYVRSTDEILNFSTVSQSPINKINLKWRSDGSLTINIKHVYLIKHDGSTVEVVPKTISGGNSTIQATTNSIPNYIKAKISDLKYSTLYYGDKNLVVPPYVTATAYSVDGKKLQVVKTYESKDVIPAGTGVVLTSENGNTYKFSISDEMGEPATGNLLRGSDEAQTTTGGDRYYMLSLNADSDPSSVGFYYAKANGAAFTNGAHKAYLALSAAQAKAFSYPFNETDGIETITNEHHKTTNGIWYTIDGKRLSGQPTRKGVYIVDGKKMIIK